jgi:hypothetical protein
MIQDQPSHTAHRVAMHRAAHQLLGVPVVFEDPLALSILGPERGAALRADPMRFEQGLLAPYLRAFLAVRGSGSHRPSSARLSALRWRLWRRSVDGAGA